MLKIKSSPTLAGIEITGDKSDLKELADAVLFIIGDEDDYPGYESCRVKLLDLCGKLVFAVNGKAAMQCDGFDLYICRVLWPDALFDISCISDYLFLYAGNEFYLKNRQNIKKYSNEENEAKIEMSYDYVDYIRFFQGAVRNELRRTIGKVRFCEFASTYLYHHIFSGATKHYEHYATQYIDRLNTKYLKTPVSERRKMLSSVFAEILNRDLHHDRYREMVIKESKKAGVLPHRYIPTKFEYPKMIEW